MLINELSPPLPETSESTSKTELNYFTKRETLNCDNITTILNEHKNLKHGVQSYISNEVKGDTCILQGDICILQGDICILQGDICIVQGDICIPQGDICILQGEICSLFCRFPQIL